MKQTTKQAKLLGLIVIFTMIVLCLTNVVHAYFSAINQVSGEITFGGNSVRFAYTYSTASTGYVDDDILVVYPVYSAGAELKRGDSFGLQIVNGGTTTNINKLSLNAQGGSSYVRLWINAYIVKNSVLDTSVNYGQYFEFTNIYASAFETKIVDVNNETRKMYYLKSPISSGVLTEICTGLTLLTTAPVEMLDKSFNITINFDSVQVENQAFKAVFDDGWGYCSSWS